MKLNRRSFMQALRMCRKRPSVKLICEGAETRSGIRDISIIRDPIEDEYTPSKDRPWRSFHPGEERIEVTIFGGRCIKKSLIERKGKECIWEVVFPDKCTFGFNGKISKIVAVPKRFFAKKIIGVVIKDISNHTYRRATG